MTVKSMEMKGVGGDAFAGNLHAVYVGTVHAGPYFCLNILAFALGIGSADFVLILL